MNTKGGYLLCAVVGVLAAQAVTQWFPVFHWKKKKARAINPDKQSSENTPRSQAMVLIPNLKGSLFSSISLSYHMLDL